MSATSGISTRFFIAETARSDAISGMAMRTMSHPAAFIAFICAAVASTSHVFVLHIDCTDTSAPPPTATPPTFIFLVASLLLFILSLS